MAQARRVELGRDEVLVHKGMEIDRDLLDSIVGSGKKRLLWAFVKGQDGDIRAVPYSEHQVIWMTDKDVLQERDVEL